MRERQHAGCFQLVGYPNQGDEPQLSGGKGECDETIRHKRIGDTGAHGSNITLAIDAHDEQHYYHA